MLKREYSHALGGFRRVYLSEGEEKPTGAGYAPGCILTDSYATLPADMNWQNIGTSEAASWDNMAPASNEDVAALEDALASNDADGGSAKLGVAGGSGTVATQISTLQSNLESHEADQLGPGGAAIVGFPEDKGLKHACTIAGNDPENPTEWTITIADGDFTPYFVDGDGVEFNTGKAGTVAASTFGGVDTTFTVSVDPRDEEDTDPTQVWNTENPGLSTDVEQAIFQLQRDNLDLIVDLAATTGAATVGYDNQASGLTADNLQEAVDEVVSDLAATTGAAAVGYDNSTSGLTAATLQAAVDETIADLAETTGAAAVGYDNAVSGLTAATVQAGIDEVAAIAGGSFEGVGINEFTIIRHVGRAEGGGGRTTYAGYFEVSTLEAVTKIALQDTIPINAIPVLAQLWNKTAITTTTATKAGLGTDADPDLFGLTADKLIDTQTAEEPVREKAGSELVLSVHACDNAGAAAGTIDSGTFGVYIEYDVIDPLVTVV